jgi:DNA polymerase-3 subunit delta'
MPFDHILGQETAVGTLKRALAADRVHHAYRFEGPSGVGKELAAFALAQALVCETEVATGCGTCSACKRAVAFSDGEPKVPLHPDVVIVQRGLYKSTLGAGASEATGVSIEQIRRVVLGRVSFTPHEGRALVFIVRAAEELTVQAANALLKTLEEPRPRTHFLLLTSRPNRLLDTIRSRTLPIRFGPLPEAVIGQILAARGLEPLGAGLAQGSAELALELADPEEKAARDAFVAGAREAIAAPNLAAGLAFADSRSKDRDGLRAELAFLSQAFADQARSEAATEPRSAERRAKQYAVVQKAIDDVERNVQPALAVEAMMVRLRALA